MKVLAAVARTARSAFTLETLELEEPRADEVLIRVVAAGVCHTDIVVRDQLLPTPLPAVLGHEGAGVVEKVGSAVRHVVPGDHVVMTFNSCGHCPSCNENEAAYCHEFFPYNFFAARSDGSTALANGSEHIHSHFFGQSSFASHALCTARNAVKVTKDLPLELLGPLACGVQTGAGAVMNALQVRPGKSLAVFGTGSVGLSAVMAARAIGVTTIIAVDPNEERLKFATEIGASHTINPGSQDVARTLLEITTGGADYTLDTTGIMTVISGAIAALAPRGTCGILGSSPSGSKLPVDEVHFMSGGRRLMGIVEGSAQPATFIPTLIELYRSGRFPFDRMIRFYPFAQINQAIHDSESGVTIKPVVRMA